MTIILHPRHSWLKNLVAVVAVLLSTAPGNPACGQGLIKTMLKQIAQLEIAYQEAKQGYQIFQEGLGFISDVKSGNLSLHSDYFSSLLSVKNPIRKDARVADIIRMQLVILDDCGKTVSQLSPSLLFTPVELAYCARVFAA